MITRSTVSHKTSIVTGIEKKKKSQAGSTFYLNFKGKIRGVVVSVESHLESGTRFNSPPRNPEYSCGNFKILIDPAWTEKQPNNGHDGFGKNGRCDG